MSTHELAAEIFQRLKKVRVIVIVFSLMSSVALILYAKQKPLTYTSSASIFPLTSTSDNNTTSATLSAILGGETQKSFSDDASINIVELALSRTTREEVAAIRDSSHGNKTIAELLIADINNHRGLFESKIKTPATPHELIIVASDILKNNLTANVNKNNMLILTYTGRDPDLVKTVSYGFINKISLFYIQLKAEKARRDFNFATKKVDSLRDIMNSKDAQLIAIDKTTLFTNTSRLQFKVPTENLIADKQMIREQYAQAVANQQNAAYKLQKATPVIQVLDKPEPPYDVHYKSPVIYGIIGLAGGFIIISLFFVSGLLLSYARDELNKAIFGGKEVSAPGKTASAL
ncbi:MAG TPA: hypothetical protein VG847_17100 [Chitinophagaceae bacterium]|nr:hypothetical protein [Chitinophagaceae bacterium]